MNDEPRRITGHQEVARLPDGEKVVDATVFGGRLFVVTRCGLYGYWDGEFHTIPLTETFEP